MAAFFKKMINQVRYGEPVILVSGLPRSGTSMTMKMLEAGGVPVMVDHIRTADEDNPKGYYEYERVKDLDKPDKDKSWVSEARGKVIKIISFLLKEVPPENFYKVVFMLRNVDEVLASQHKMLDRRGEEDATEDEKMKQNYESHLWRTKYLLKHSKNFEAIFIEYKKVLESPQEQAEMINEFFQGKLDVEKMVGVVDPKLYRNRR